MYEFQSTFFRNVREMADAIAYECLSAGGSNNLDVQREFLNSQTDKQMADEAIEGWSLSGEWAEARDFERDDLIEAFSRLRHQHGEPKP